MKRHIYTHWASTSEPFVLNLDPGFKPIQADYLQLDYIHTTFLGGDPNFRIKTEVTSPDKLIITQRFNSVADLMLIILANDAARRLGYKEIQLVLPYFPGARQDRICNEGEPLTVKVFADMINLCNFNKVFIYSPHSEVTPALLNNVVLLDLDNTFLVEILKKECPKQEDNKINIVCPDAGAGKRVASLAKHLVEWFPYNQVNLIRCEKVRDVATGQLKEFFVQADDLNGYPYYL